MQGEYLKLKM